jgi:hypothetical protein
MSNKEQALLQIGRLKEMEDGKQFEFVINKLLQDRFTNRIYSQPDREKVIEQIYNDFKIYLNND